MCPDCGQPFPEPELKVHATASTAAVISTQVQPEWHNVIGMLMRRHEKTNKPPSLRVSYYTTTGIFDEWLCFEHNGFAREKAVAWHKKRIEGPAPATIDAALALTYPQPSRILVRLDGKFWRVLQYDYSEGAPATIAPPVETRTREQIELEEYEIPF